MKIILIIFITVNDSLNLTHCLLMAFSHLEKRKHKNFLEKHNAGARANIEQKPYEASLNFLEEVFLRKCVKRSLKFFFRHFRYKFFFINNCLH